MPVHFTDKTFPLRPTIFLWALLLSMTAAPSLLPQQPCAAPPLSNTKQSLNIFTDQQEVDLGDAVADQMQQRLRVTDNPQLTGYLQAVGERLEKELPPNHLKFRYYLLEIPEANALSLPGGRIYVSPKLIAMAQNEDELAGVLAHEMGHIITHQSAITTSQLLKAVLGVTQVGDRADINDKVHQLIANQARGRKTLQKISEQEEQEGADVVAVYTAARAGYAPKSFEGIFDRLVGTKGKKGNWFTDIFGGTPSNSVRLREMSKAIGQLPSACLPAAPHEAVGQFKTWQESVIAFSGWNHEELLHSVVTRTKLDPPLRTDINHLKFSPNGQYVLAQDDSIIYVLTRQPFKMLFTIDAPDALPAQFTPDSQSVVFSNPGLRVEVWSVATARRTSVRELFVSGGCRQSLLSPDAGTLACFTSQERLSILDVASGAVLVEKPFPLPMFWNFLSFFGLEGVDIFPAIQAAAAFSPDSRYFLAGTREFRQLSAAGGGVTFAFDLKDRRVMSLPGSINKLLSSGFTFLGADRLVGVNFMDPNKSAVVSFPDGKILEELSISTAQKPVAISKGEYVLLRPAGDYAAGLLDLKTQKFILGSKTRAFDIYDWEYISEARNGELGLFDIKTANPVTGIALPPGHLAHLSTAAVEPDFNWLAVSSRSRGVVWDLSKGKSVYELRRFNGAYFKDKGELYLDFPKYESTERSIVRMNLPGPRMAPEFKIDAKYALQQGRYLVVLRPKDSDHPRFDRDVTYEFHDAATNRLLWSHLFPKDTPKLAIEPEARTVIFYQLASDDGAREEAKGDPKLESLVRSRENEKDDVLVEVLDAETGKRTGALVVKTHQASVRVKDIFAAGNWVVLADRENEVVVYSLSDGEEKARIFGDLPEISASTGTLALRTEEEGLVLYDLDSMEQRDEFYFSSPIVMEQFSSDGKRLFVLTADQTVFVLKVSSEAGPVTSAANPR